MNKPTLSQFLDRQVIAFGTAPALCQLVAELALACKHIAAMVNRGALTGSMGELASENVQGEVQKQLDVITNQIMVDAGLSSAYVAGMASEEMEQVYDAPEPASEQRPYLLLFDPLDGSSNVNVNISVGTIFSVLRCPSGVARPRTEHYLQPGSAQQCAGYALYGSSTMLVFTLGQGVHGFTLDQAGGEFVLTHEQLRIPASTAEFAINMSNQRHWQPPMQRYIAECLAGREGPRGKDFNMRWVASMVAEVHRILIRGGVFLYPLDARILEQGGKLRLMYEANPMAWIVEQAGGQASTGLQRILELVPQALHQRVPVMLGAGEEVELVNSYHLQPGEMA